MKKREVFIILLEFSYSEVLVSNRKPPGSAGETLKV